MKISSRWNVVQCELRSSKISIAECEIFILKDQKLHILKNIVFGMLSNIWDVRCAVGSTNTAFYVSLV